MFVLNDEVSRALISQNAISKTGRGDRMDANEQQIALVMKAIRQLMAPPETVKRRIGFRESTADDPEAAATTGKP
jgi:hypothetical protein